MTRRGGEPGTRGRKYKIADFRFRIGTTKVQSELLNLQSEILNHLYVCLSDFQVELCFFRFQVQPFGEEVGGLLGVSFFQVPQSGVYVKILIFGVGLEGAVEKILCFGRLAGLQEGQAAAQQDALFLRGEGDSLAD